VAARNFSSGDETWVWIGISIYPIKLMELATFAWNGISLGLGKSVEEGNFLYKGGVFFSVIVGGLCSFSLVE